MKIYANITIVEKLNVHQFNTDLHYMELSQSGNTNECNGGDLMCTFEILER